MRFPLLLIACLSVSAACCAGAIGAVPEGVKENPIYAGWEVRSPGQAFDTVSAEYTVPRLNCAEEDPQDPGAVAVWIGLAGAGHIEQAGVAAECRLDRPQGLDQAVLENYPQPSAQFPRPVGPGDRMYTSITVHGHHVDYLTIDRSRGWKEEIPTVFDHPHEGHAEWIVERPEANAPQFFPLSDFRPVTFTQARTGTAAGTAGAIGDPAWDATRLWMDPAATALPEAESGTLAPGGAGFTVTRVNLEPPTDQ